MITMQKLQQKLSALEYLPWNGQQYKNTGAGGGVLETIFLARNLTITDAASNYIRTGVLYRFCETAQWNTYNNMHCINPWRAE